jgi:hypothetical protein
LNRYEQEPDGVGPVAAPGKFEQTTGGKAPAETFERTYEFAEIGISGSLYPRAPGIVLNSQIMVDRFIATLKKSHVELAVAEDSYAPALFGVRTADGRDCGTALHVRSYNEASSLLGRAGISNKELREKFVPFQRNQEVRFAFTADTLTILELGFEPPVGAESGKI